MTNKRDSNQKVRNWKDEPAIVINRSILGGWFCIKDDLTEDELLMAIGNLVFEKKHLILSPPIEDKELMRTRLFGGFKCADDKTRRHVYLAVGYYIFSEPELNEPLNQETRQEIWEELIKHNPDSFIGGKNFVSDSPEIQEFPKGD